MVFGTTATKTVEKALLATTILCVGTAYMSFAGQIAPAYATAFMLLSLVGAVFDLLEIVRGRAVPRPPRLLLNLLSVGILASAVSRITLDTLVEVFTEAVLLMIAIKMLEQKRSRDYAQIAGMSVLTVLSAAISSTSDVFIYYCFLVSMFSGFLLLLSSFVQPSAAGGRTVAPVSDFAGLLRWGFYLWLGMLPICLLLFFAAPRARDTALNFRGGSDDRTTVGFSEQVTLGSIKKIQESGEIAFRAELTGMTGLADLVEIPQLLMYWRGIVLDRFDGTAWSSSPGGSCSRGGSAFIESGHRVTQQIVLEPGSHRRLFALDRPIDMTGEGIFPVGEAEYVRGRSGARRFSYSAVSILSPVMKTSEPIRRELFLMLPPDFIPRLRQLVAELTGTTQGMNDAEKMTVLREYFRPPAYAYSLDDLPVSRNALEDFIFSHKKGNCEYFASALAVMLRIADVPARLVAGYYGGVYNEAGEYYIVEQAAAHVWVEAWDAAAGVWRRLDPTPVVSAFGTESATKELGMFQLYFDLFNYRLSRIFIQYDRDAQQELVEKLRRIFSASQPAPSLDRIVAKLAGLTKDIPFAGRLRRILFAVAGALSIVVIVLAVRKKRESIDARLLRKFLRAMTRIGYAKEPGEGLEEFVKRVRRAETAEKTASEDRRAALNAAESFVRVFQRYYFKDIPIESDIRSELEKKIAIIRGSRM